jgi:hypothetical protein
MTTYVINSGMTAANSYSIYANTSVTGSGFTYPTGPNWNTTAITHPSPKVQITDGDIVMDGVSLRDTMAKLQDRLAILQPKPEHLEQFEALKQAYDHYKMLEALCCPSKPADK